MLTACIYYCADNNGSLQNTWKMAAQIHTAGLPAWSKHNSVEQSRNFKTPGLFLNYLVTTFLLLMSSPLVQVTQELCESGGGRPELPVPNITYGLCGRKAALNLNLCHTELRSCVKVEVAVLGSPSLIFFMVSVDVKRH